MANPIRTTSETLMVDLGEVHSYAYMRDRQTNNECGREPRALIRMQRPANA